MNESYNEFLSTWESQQNALIEMREQRFSFMMNVIENSHSKVDNILDVGCGPGSFTIRLAERFPQARIYSIDYDPVLLRIAKNNVSKYGSRVRILEYDLKGNEWLHAIDDEKFDAIVSTTALHWIPKPNLKSLYKNFYTILKSGGIFMDGDHFRSNNDSEYIQNLYSKI
ncbi:methyltransferase domain-containing protein, partial [Ferroplasma sp. Type II]|uniref:class I SAM-dependent methyltransferase n=1 Tax=Ferroplasma sp. Type II TaxID=261388 RepID=UPI0025B90D91